MKKHSGEEKTDLKTGPGIFSFFILLIIFCDILSAQIPINGFSNFVEFETVQGQNRIFSLNYNKDSYSDILLYNQDNKTAHLLTGQPNLKFSKPQKLFFIYEPNFFKPVYNSQNQIVEYAFTSRKSRIFGLINFNRYGYPRISKFIKLNSFPNKIDNEDVDLDNSEDYLVSGESFEGLSIISEKNNSLVEKKFFTNHSFLDARFFDINSDEYIDILAYDLITQKLFFIYNKDGERFEKKRELFINQLVNQFHTTDINFDGYRDLVFSTENGLLIYFGDNLNVFNQSTFIKTYSSITNFSIGDFNHDGYFDFICHSSEKNYLSVIFAKDADDFFEEIIFDYGKKVEELIPFFSRFVYGVAILSNSGYIKIISEFSSFNKDVNFIFGINPVSIQTFDINNNTLPDFIFIDKFDNKLKFILRNNRGMPAQYYHIDLKGVHNEIFILRKSASEIIIYCYSRNERLIEILEINFDNFKFTQDFIYTEGVIQDLWSTMVNGNAEIKILYSRGNSLNYGILKLSLYRKYNLVKYPSVSENFITANIISESEDKIIYWNKIDTLLILNSVNYLFDTKQEKRLFTTFSTESIELTNNISKHKNSLDYLSSFFQISEKKYLLIFNREFNILTKSELLTDYSINSQKPVVFDNDGFMYFFDSKQNRVFRIIYLKRTKDIIIKPLFDNVRVAEFTVSKLDKRNKHLIFIDTDDQKIKTRLLN